MGFSKVDICNMALSHIGEVSIQSFEDNNRRARLCNTLFVPYMLTVLTDIDWAFARRFKQLQEISSPANVDTTEGLYTYGLPSDCLVPRDLHPKGSQDSWEVIGRYLQCQKSYDQGVYLYYTTSEVVASDFTHAFAITVAAAMAMALAPSLTQDVKLTALLTQQYERIKADAWHSDTNTGNNYREYDGDPENDTFVNVG
jgi:hypothetical protein